MWMLYFSEIGEERTGRSVMLLPDDTLTQAVAQNQDVEEIFQPAKASEGPRQDSSARGELRRPGPLTTNHAGQERAMSTARERDTEGPKSRTQDSNGRRSRVKSSPGFAFSAPQVPGLCFFTPRWTWG